MEEVQEEEGEDAGSRTGRRREEKEVKTSSSSVFESRLSFPGPPCLPGSRGTGFPRIKDDFPPWLCPLHTPCRVAL